MQQSLFTVIVLRRPNGRPEIIKRAGHHDPDQAARTFEALLGGKAIAVRHEQVSSGEARPRPVAIHRMG